MLRISWRLSAKGRTTYLSQELSQPDLSILGSGVARRPLRFAKLELVPSISRSGAERALSFTRPWGVRAAQGRGLLPERDGWEPRRLRPPILRFASLDSK